jgi:hypothetical protein
MAALEPKASETAAALEPARSAAPASATAAVLAIGQETLDEALFPVVRTTT